MSEYRTISTDNIPQLFSVKDKVVLVAGAGGLTTPVIRAYAHNGARLAIGTRNGTKPWRWRRSCARRAMKPVDMSWT